MGYTYHRSCASKFVDAIQQAALKGSSYGAPSPLAIDLAKSIMDLIPNIEMLRFINSGTEATMSALRLARAYTKREEFFKFDGCYHCHADMFLVQAGSGVATLGLPDSPAVPADTVKDTLVANFNDLDSVEALFKKYPYQIAAIIVEPVASNMGVSPPQPRFLKGLRAITSRDSSGSDACAAVVSMPQPDPETHLRSGFSFCFLVCTSN